MRLLQLVSPTQQFAIDTRDLFEDLLDPLIVEQKSFDLIAVFLKHVLLFGSAAGIADRQIVFWTMAVSICALASRFAAADVAFDQ